MAIFQSPSRRTPATRPPLAACGSAFHCGGPISLSSPREYPVEPMTCAMYSPAPLSSFLSCGLTAAKNRSEEHTSELQSRGHLVCRLLLEKKKKKQKTTNNRKLDSRH